MNENFFLPILSTETISSTIEILDFGSSSLINIYQINHKSSICCRFQIRQRANNTTDNNYLYTIQNINKVNKRLRLKRVAGCCRACFLFIVHMSIVCLCFGIRNKECTHRRIAECKYWVRSTSLSIVNLLHSEHVESRNNSKCLTFRKRCRLQPIDIEIYKYFIF